MPATDNNTRIVAPVSLDDLHKVFGGNVLENGHLCRLSPVNRWSKHKAVAYGSFKPGGDTHLRGNGVSTVWGCMVDIVDGTGMVDDMYESSINHYNWEWDYPYGGHINQQGILVGTPYRREDFDGYNHLAGPVRIATNIQKGVEEQMYVSNTMTESSVIRLTAECSSVADSITWDDILYTLTGTRNASQYSLRMCASVYCNGVFMDEYINNSIKMWDASSPSVLDEGYDTATEKHVDVSLDKGTYWGSNKNVVDIYLSLVLITRYNGQWQAEKFVALPYTDENYYKKKIRFVTYSRIVRAMKMHVGATPQGTRNWQPIDTTSIRLSDTTGTPDIMFEVSRTNDTLVFENGITYLRTRYVRKDGTEKWTTGILTSESGSAVPRRVSVPAAVTSSDYNELVPVYFSFGNFLEEKTTSEGLYPAGNYRVELYLVNRGVQIDDKVGEFIIRLSN